MPETKAWKGIRTVDVGMLRPAAYNPRTISDEALEEVAKSISRYGFVEPVVVNMRRGREWTVVGGHQKLRAAVSLGRKEVPCVAVDLDAEAEKELNLRLNRNTGRWDDVKLAAMGEDALLEAGFSESELVGIQARAGTLDGIEVEGEASRAPILAAFATEREYLRALAHYTGGDAAERTASLVAWWREG